ncbi:uncharacterized protein VP01_5661g1 [Puccinia sorghi]|uniref:CCHC-type domain-containing protein n=1 Tax=Puccinia sorghi TaxID=27349 RepID=A0A0L6UIX2_9BASI|nr:uncharacterized protein VP01_5661g1 [Puccinia sorghi]
MKILWNYCKKTDKIPADNKFLQLSTKIHAVDQQVSSLSGMICEKFEQLHQSIQTIQDTRRSPLSLSPDKVPSGKTSTSQAQNPNNREVKGRHIHSNPEVSFIRQDFELGDLAISGRLSSLLKGNARRLFNDVRIANYRKPWKNDSPVKWLLCQTLWPNVSLQDMHPRILKKCGGNLEHAKILQPELKFDKNTGHTGIGNKDSSKESNPHKDKKCYTCQKIGHTSATCTQKRKNVNQVDAREEISEPDKEDEESVHEFEEESSLSEMSNNIIQVDLDIADVVCDHHLPQEWKGKGYTAGNSNLTTVILNEQEAEMLLDSGGFCSIVPKTYLQKLHQDFRDSLLTAGKVKLNSSSSAMKRVGIFPCFLIIPHPTGGIHCGRGWSQ